MFRVAYLRSGESLLMHAAAGGVGLAVLQLAKTIPNLTIFGTASKGKHDIIKKLGCTHTIDYPSLDYADEVRRLTSGRGVDAVFDSLGGKDWKKGYSLLKPAGRLVAFGFSNMSNAGGGRSLWRVIKEGVKIPFYLPMKLMDDNKTVSGVNMGHLWDETELLGFEMRQILELYEKGIVDPHIDSTFRFEEAGEAHRRIEERKNVGKVLLIP
jgi:NADPH:quinone reductase-like Zn-dependent oxidoreductase